MRRREFARTSLTALGALSLERLGGGSFSVHDAGRVSHAATRSGAGPSVNGDRLNAHLTAMSAFGKNPAGGVSRVAYSDFDLQGREYTKARMREAGLTVTVDSAGNIWGRRAGRDASRAPIAFGSHIDSVPEGGNYDGTVGSFAAIEVAQTLAEAKITTRHPLDIVIFQNEEGGTVGSRALVGEVSASDLTLQSKSGRTIGEGIAVIGGDPNALDKARRARGDFTAYVELHIEQGGTLEAAHIDIGVVEGIVGIGWWDVTIEGFANHAGTTPMGQRHDAMRAAAQFIELVNMVVTSVPGRQVGTVGRLQPFPGAPNVIPGKVVCSLELRELDAAKQDMLFARIRDGAQAIGAKLGTTFRYEPTHHSAPALCDPRIQQAVADSAKGRGLTTRTLPSGAGHDAQHMAQLCPSGMIFVPSIGGISHAPKEFSTPGDITNGANVLLSTILSLDAATWS